MSFDYDKISHKGGEHSSWWTSYADLFMMLSIVFLLMYVASSLRSGSAGFQQQQAYKQLEKKAQDLEEQIRVYNTLKEETLRNQSSDQEQQVYQKLMSHLTLLQDEAHDEKLALQQKAKENEEKEFALNQYQQLIRNIVNANILAKAQITHRDQLIVRKDATIEEKQKTLGELQGTIAQNQQKITDINNALARNVEALEHEQQHSRLSKAAMDRKIAALRKESEEKVQQLKGSNNVIAAQLQQVQGTLVETQQSLTQASATIQEQEAANQALKSKLEQEKANYLTELGELQTKHKAQLAVERAVFERNLKRQQLSHTARAKKLADYLKREKMHQSELEGQLAGLEGKISDTENRLRGTEAQLQGTKQALGDTQQKLAGAEAERGRALANVQNLQGDLARMREIANVRRKLAQEISNQFAKSGLKGAVDPKTGEVTLDFGQEYFETGSTLLKPGMRTTLDKFIPLYAKGLFSDPKVADKIASVEVVGFASSTYKGKYVNPKSVRASDKEAIDYNLRLSFGRANSIFKHVLNEKDLSKKDRDKLLPLMKVVGRGYLPEGVSAGDLPDGMTEKQFCAKYACKKAQKVIVKFNMKD